jgi:hypothetical protein
MKLFSSPFKFGLYKRNLNSSPVYLFLFFRLKGTVQRELRGVKIVINRSITMSSFAGKCPLPCPKGHHHERSINVFQRL